MSNTIPENPANLANDYILDPLTVIIKLAILKNKPVGTKICIQRNVVYLQEPGPFQAICRYVFNTNKTDLQFMYNPIYIACETYLSADFVKTTPRIKLLFTCAMEGIRKLMETYKNCSVIHLCLNYYYAIITNYMADTSTLTLFYKDGMTSMYTPELIDKLKRMWTPDKIKVVLNMVDFLVKDEQAASNVKLIETIMCNIDADTKMLIFKV